MNCPYSVYFCVSSNREGVGIREWGKADKENNQFPMPINYFVFLILFNCDAQISKAFANIYYLSW